MKMSNTQNYKLQLISESSNDDNGETLRSPKIQDNSMIMLDRRKQQDGRDKELLGILKQSTI